MNSASHESAAPSCDYCGHANPDRLIACQGCGHPLVSAELLGEGDSDRKSKGLAVFLALIFGPLGLIYVGAWKTALHAILAGAPFLLTGYGGLWLTICSRLLCAAWAYHVVVEQDTAPNAGRDAEYLLNVAGRLESVDRTQAIAVYTKVIHKYPGTSASKEAANNIEVLNRNQIPQHQPPRSTVIR